MKTPSTAKIDRFNLVPDNRMNKKWVERAIIASVILLFVVSTRSLAATAQNGSTWSGAGFDSYNYHFDGTGQLFDPPITTHDYHKFNTLNGLPPIVIGHRGAAGKRPEETLASYQVAIADGADYIEPDCVITKDGILIARHEPMLAALNANGTLNTTNTTTDIYKHPEFADRKTTKVLDGQPIAGWFAEDFTLAEIKTLNAIERLPALRGTAYDNDNLKVISLDEIIDWVQQHERTTGIKIGIYPETKHPTYFQTEGKYIDGSPIDVNLSQKLVAKLVERGFTDPSRVFIQSFEVGNLQELKSKIFPQAGIDLPLIQLTGASGSPYDTTYTGKGLTYADMMTPTGLAGVAKYATGIGPDKRAIVPATTIDRNNDGKPDDLNGDGQISDADRITGTPTTLITDAHQAGLQVHPYTLRDDPFFVASNYKNAREEYQQFINLSVDGFFTDFAVTGYDVRREFIGTCSFYSQFCLDPARPPTF
jgi:glycerophosphoryl diester phosphodiesterase